MGDISSVGGVVAFAIPYPFLACKVASHFLVEGITIPCLVC